ncbi:MAG TPA: hypothetical protein VKQ06_04550, partial [Gammaproteobacteria bacterium]|nr:hypothetical protein [Gammaproteobacteria bacterium]
SSAGNELERMRGEIAALEKQVAAQNQVIDQNESHARQNKALNEELAELRSRVESQKEFIDKAEDEARHSASLKAELSTLQTEVASLRRESSQKDEALEQLRGRVDSEVDTHESLQRELQSARNELAAVRSNLERAQSELATAQKETANLHSETNVLHSESSEKEKAIERIRSELESKQELIQALRRDNETARSELRGRDDEVRRLKSELGRAEVITGELRAELQLMLDTDKEGVADHSAELQALRAELEARKAVIKSLRADAERFDALEARLDEKRRVNAKLEESLSYHATTIADLKRSAENWRRKYQDLRLDASGEYKVEPTFTETDMRAIENLQKKGGSLPEHTIAIDMRESLAEARRSSGQADASKK